MRSHQGRRQLLVQGKAEPGNVGLVQLAPTCQATSSNARRLHGGTAPPFIDFFPEGDSALLYNAEQSEQGTRFLYKRNRNALAVTAERIVPTSTHQWLDVDSVLDLMHHDYIVNTDARSVLVCAPWERLVNRAPFSRYRDGFGSELLMSSLSASQDLVVDQVKARIVEQRAITERPDVIPLDALSAWHLDENGVSPLQGSALRVRQIRVRINGREVPEWDQPIVDSATDGHVLLVCGRIGGVLHFLFRARAEAGLASGVELTPTAVVEPGHCYPTSEGPGTIVADVYQSDEGGRFFCDTNHYRIIDIGSAVEAPPRHYWLTLSDIRLLLDESGWMTNESRSVLSLLLPWM